MTRREVATRAIREALLLRAHDGVVAIEAVCPYDLAERLGIDVRFLDLPSLEGMYVAGEESTIFIGALRPPGRQAFTCAHELGHHALRHGTRVDELVGDRHTPSQDLDEYAADCFAAFLLMPRPAVLAALRCSTADPAVLSPEEIYVAANWLGVGYSALVTHLRSSLHILGGAEADTLNRAHLSVVRAALAGPTVTEGLVVAEESWTGRPIDLLTNEVLAAPRSAQCEERCLTKGGTFGARALFYPVRPGIDRLHDESSGWAAYVRVGRSGYVGRAIYRHLEDPEYDVSGTDPHHK